MNIGPQRAQLDFIGDIDWGDFPVNLSDLTGTISTVISAAWTIAGVAAVALVIYGGYSIMIATGDPQKMKKGQDTLAYAVVGLVVVIASGAILRYIASLLGFDLALNLPFL